MQVQFYNFSKRYNSTKIVSGSPALIDMRLKDNCDMINPVFETHIDVTNMNYAYVSKWGRYYFVDSPSFDNGLYTISMHVDVMATYKSSIISTSAYIAYASGGSSNLKDGRIAVSGNFDRQVTTSPFAGALSNQKEAPTGTFCLTVLAKDARYPTGVMTTYFMTYNQMRQFANQFVDPPAFEEVAQYFTNPFDAIAECAYIPLDISPYIVTADIQHVKVAEYDTGVIAKCASATNFAIQPQHTTLTIDWRYGDYRDLDPFTALELYVPFCGSQPISPSSVYGLEQIFIDYAVDFISGNVEAFAWNKHTILAEFSGNCKTLIPIAQSQPTPYAAIASVANDIGVGPIGHSIISSQRKPASQSPGGLLFAHSSTKIAGGFNGSPLGAIIGNDTMRWQQFVLSRTSHDSSNSPGQYRSVMGLPYCGVATISAAASGGYVQTEGFSVAINGTAEERDMINQIMDGGAYID